MAAETKLDSFYLPYTLSPQGWLVDILLGQLHDEKNESLRRLYRNTYYKNKNKFFADNKLLILSPKCQNKLKSVIQITPNKPSNNDFFKDLTNKKEYADFMLKMTPTQQSFLHPYIRIFLKYETEDKKQKQRDIIFKTFTDISDILRFDYGRMGSAGIESVSVNREMPSFGLEQHFTVNMKFFFSSMATFVKGHPADLINDSKREDYLKLISPLGRIETVDGKTKNTRKEVLCLEYGWNFSDSTPFDVIPYSMREKIKAEETKRFELVWTSHNFNFNQNGEISVDASYVGTPEHVFKQPLKVDNKKSATIFHQIETVAPLYSGDNVKLENYKKLLADYEKTTEEIKKIQKDIKEKKEHKKADNKCGSKTTGEKLQKNSIKLREIISELAGMSLDIFTKKIIKDGQMFQSSFYGIKDSKTHNLFTGIGVVPEDFDVPVLSKDGLGFEDKRLFKIENSKMVPDILEHEYVINQLSLNPEKVLKILDDKKISILSKKLLKESQKNKKSKDVILENLNNKIAALTYSHHASPIKKKGGAGHKESTFGNFYFFPLRALLATLYEQTKEDRETVIGLGNVIHRFNGEPAWINLGDIPVELGVFKKWYYHNLVTEGNIKWKFGDFVDDVMETLVPRILKEYSAAGGTNFGPIMRSNYSLSEPPSKELLDELFDEEGSKSLSKFDNSLKKLSRLIKKPTKKIKTGFVFYGQMITEQIIKEQKVTNLFNKIGDRTLTRDDDHGDGMYHINIGEDRGILLDINFQHQNDDALQTALLFDKNQDTAVPFLKAIYESTPMMFGNNLFSEGGFFVIPINPLGVSPREDPGIRGYYRVDKVTDVITPGSYTTSVHGVNVHNGQPKKPKNTNKPKSGNNLKGQEKETKPKKIPVSIGKGVVDHIQDTLKFVNIQKTFNLKYDECAGEEK